ncbi:MAG: DdrH [Deinococcales bacterium]
MNQDFAAIIEQLKKQHATELEKMPLPLGAAEFLAQKILEQDVETVQFMLKLAWIFGAQAGQQAVVQAQWLESQQRKPRIEA